MNFFRNLELLREDPILGLAIEFRKDSRKDKVNLGIGSYKDADGNPLVFLAVRNAEEALLHEALDKEYPPIVGNEEFCSLLAGLIFREKKEQISFSMQTIGATGALRMIASLLSRGGASKAYISNPTWPNHKAIFEAAGLECSTYPYYTTPNPSIDRDAFLQAAKQLPKGSILLVQTSCHNPTGFDPDTTTWDEFCAISEEKEHFVVFDAAYQGLGNGLEEDMYPARAFCNRKIPFALAYSCSKNFGLYGERVGALYLLNLENVKDKIGTNFRQLVRAQYSVPPLAGQRIVRHILQNASLTKSWQQELSSIRNRISEMREALVSELDALGKDSRFEFMRNQKGFFSYTGLTKEQVLSLKEEHGIYMTENGRINVAGLNFHNMDRTVAALIAVSGT